MGRLQDTRVRLASSKKASLLQLILVISELNFSLWNKEFLQSVTQFARDGTKVMRLFDKNDIEALHVTEKRIPSFKTDIVLEAVTTIKILIEK